jgi:hypothetical protein
MMGAEVDWWVEVEVVQRAWVLAPGVVGWDAVRAASNNGFRVTGQYRDTRDTRDFERVGE